MLINERYGAVQNRFPSTLNGFGSFGTVSPYTGTDCVDDGSWEGWCDCIWPASSDASLNQKCKSKPLWILTAAPWTETGAKQRGIPNVNDPGTASADAQTTWQEAIGTIFPGVAGKLNPQQTQPTPKPSEGIFGIPKTVAIVGGVVLVGGAAAFLLLRKKSAPAMAGYRRRRR